MNLGAGRVLKAIFDGEKERGMQRGNHHVVRVAHAKTVSFLPCAALCLLTRPNLTDIKGPYDQHKKQTPYNAQTVGDAHLDS